MPKSFFGGRVWPRFGLLLTLLLLLAAASVGLAHPDAAANAAVAAGSPGTAAFGHPVVGHEVKHDTSPALARLPVIRPGQRAGQLGDRDSLERPLLSRVAGEDPVVQRTLGALAGGPSGMPRPQQNFDGMYNYWGYYPPDTNGDVGPNNYVQIVNIGFQIWNKSGVSLYGPADTNSLWQGFGGLCEVQNDGDPIALYDPLADRWMISQFAVPGPGPFHQCIAVSTSGDPTGSYYRYDFAISSTLFNDYPHFGVWPDGYYASFNMYRNNTLVGAEPVVFDRAAMLAGRPATFQAFAPDHANSSFLPADLDGATPPPAGEPNIYGEVDLAGAPQLRFYNFHVDWANPAASTFTPAGAVAVAPFNIPCIGAHNCISQPGTSNLLDALADRLMYRLAYRNFGDHQVLVTNHTVDAAKGGTVNAGVRWYEFRSPPGASFVPTLYQQGTFAPDSDNRWMGSVAMDHNGNLAVGYSVSSSTTYPSIRYAGRLASDPLGSLAQGEATLMTGTGSETGTAGRWGDYSMLAVDPSDDCTFWYTQEYFSATGERNWRTRIGSFKFRGCAALPPPPTPTAAGPTFTPTPPPAPTATPCAGSVTYSGSITNSDATQVGRLARDGVPSSCAAPKTCPGVADSIVRHYDSYTYHNPTNSPQCVTVTVQEACGNNALLSAAYLGSYDPTNVCTNYLADMGVSGPTFSYSFTAPANANVVVVVVENSANVGCASYTLQLNPCPAP